jgi:hypothetical protein
LVTGVVCRSRPTSDDEYASTFLGKAVVGGVDDAPFNLVPEVCQGREHDREIAASLTAR